MKLTKKDRLILINQFEILAALNPASKSHYDEVVEILVNGYKIFYSEFDDWVANDRPVEEGRFVLEILGLYRVIEDVKRKTENQQLNAHRYSFFRGFDGNTETGYMLFCRFLIETQGKFQEQRPYLSRNDNLNSHTPLVEKYQRMIDKAPKPPELWEMTADEALSILDA
jgi:uncharacterized protein YfbU (UPF0304 family)